MTDLGTFWFDLALIAGVLAMWFCISDAMCEAVIGTIAQLSFGATSCAGILDAKLDWQILKLTRKGASIGSVSFLAPFFSSAVAGEYLSAWRAMSSWLPGGGLGEPRRGSF